MHHAINKDEVEVQLHSFLPGYSHRTECYLCVDRRTGVDILATGKKATLH